MPVYKDKKRGTWYVKVSNPPKMKRGFERKKDAELWERDFLNSFEVQKDVTKLTFQQLYDIYILDELNKKKSTFATKRSLFEKYILPYFASMYIENISSVDIRQFQIQIANLKLSDGTKYSIIKQLKAIFNYSVKFLELEENPCKNIDNFKIRKKEMKFYTLDEFNCFISKVNNELDKLIYIVLFFSGMRIGELCALQWKDIDWEQSEIDISKTLFSVTGKPYNITTPKTESSYRSLAMPQKIMDHLYKYYVSFNKMDYFSDEWYVFGDITPLQPRTIRKRLERFYDVHNDMKRIRVHDFRHSNIAYMIYKGVSPYDIISRTGHSTTKQIDDTYGHLYPNSQRKVINVMDNDI